MAGGVVIGGGQQRYQGVQPPAPQQEGTAQVLMKMAQPVLERKLKEKQEQAFAQGMQRVAVGEAYKDVKSGSDTFLNEIFGPSATVQGATAMAQVKAVDDFNAQMFADMQGNAEMSPDAFREHAVKGMSGFLTGDDMVDTVVQTKMVESLPSLMKTQAKANYAWTQQQSINQFNGMLQSAGNVFGKVMAQAADGIVNEDDQKLATLQLIKSIQPVPGMNGESYKKAILDSTTLAMNGGNFWVYKALQQNGMLQLLDVDDQTKLETARTAAETRAAREIGFNKFGSQIGMLVGGAAGRSPKENHDMANAINEKYMKMTGSDTGLLDTKDIVSMDSRYFSRMYKNQDKMRELSAKANLDAQADGRLAVQAYDLVMRGAGKIGIDAGVPSPKFDAAFNSIFESLAASGQGDQALGVATRNWVVGSGYINPQLQGTLQAPIRAITQGAAPGPEFDRSIEVFNQWRQQKDSQGAIDAYFGPENVVAMERYTSALGSNFDRAQAAKIAFGNPITKAPSMTSADMLPVTQKIVIDEIEGKGMMRSLDRWWHNIPSLTEGSKKLVIDTIKPDASLYMNNLGMPPAAAIKRSMEGPAKNKLDIVGPFAYIKPDPSQPPLAALVGTDNDSLAKLFPQFLQDKAREQAIYVNVDGASEPLLSKPGSASYFNNATDLTNWWGGGKADVTLMRGKDEAGPDGKRVGVFTGILSTEKGESANVSFTSKELKDYYEQQIRTRNDWRDSVREHAELRK